MAVSLRPGQDVLDIIPLIAIPWQSLDLIPRGFLIMQVKSQILYCIEYSKLTSTVLLTSLEFCCRDRDSLAVVLDCWSQNELVHLYIVVHQNRSRTADTSNHTCTFILNK